MSCLFFLPGCLNQSLALENSPDCHRMTEVPESLQSLQPSYRGTAPCPFWTSPSFDPRGQSYSVTVISVLLSPTALKDTSIAHLLRHFRRQAQCWAGSTLCRPCRRSGEGTRSPHRHDFRVGPSAVHVLAAEFLWRPHADQRCTTLTNIHPGNRTSKALWPPPLLNISGSVQAFHTRSTVASKTRVKTRSCFMCSSILQSSSWMIFTRYFCLSFAGEQLRGSLDRELRERESRSGSGPPGASHIAAEE